MLDKDQKIEPNLDASSDQLSGIRIGIVILTILSIAVILGLVLSACWPSAYERLRTVVEVIVNY
jgi:hypothetical protein